MVLGYDQLFKVIDIIDGVFDTKDNDLSGRSGCVDFGSVTGYRFDSLGNLTDRDVIA
jgi:hypothetical protein